ncbi:hypothetical protein COU54_01170 [Candidatus Pacearchaeota archaeon CG10_big_fil_rev_8_21_14_0_10_31_24]|nr:MAG: hypothetical protein COU54_01170 [Candidatus Pacearchaeota archaeon CG10_big_fil_rev_8_21_14_0_10_31_24]
MKKRVYLELLSFLAILVIPLASASISITPLNSIYNVGDDFSVDFGISQSENSHKFLSASLNCEEGSIEIYKSPLAFVAGEQKYISIPANLDLFLINNLRTECYVNVSYGNDIQKSSVFDISSEILVNVKLNSLVVNAGEEVSFSGTVVKKNAQQVDGSVTLAISDLDITSSVQVENGVFNSTLKIPSNAPSNTYELNFFVNEKDDNDEIINEGSAVTYFKVPQLAKRGEIAVSKSSIVPGEDFSYTILIYDQAGNVMIVDNNVTIYTPSGTISEVKTQKSDEKQVLDIPSNIVPGKWRIDIRYGEISSSKILSVQELRKVSYSLQDGVLVVDNVGNVPYEGPIAVDIGDSKEVVEVSIPIEGKQQFKLSAPPGSYPITINEGESSVPLGEAFLTGRAIKIRDVEKLDLSVSPILWWLMAILIAATVTIYTHRRVSLKSYFGRAPEARTINVTHANNIMPAQEEGKKQECAIVSLFLKNSGQSDPNSPIPDTVEKILYKARVAKAINYNQGDHKVMIFPESKFENQSLSALILAKEIKKELEEHNKKYASKISFGIGINKGPMISERSGDTTKFTSVGSTLVSAKRVAEQASADILITEEIRKNLLGKIKVHRVGDKLWRINDLVQRDPNSEFIKRFMDRQK